jgi:putative sigma-54 modulation protein
MSTKFTTKNVKFTGALKGFTEKSLKNIEKISGDIIDAEILASEEKLHFKVEISLKTKDHKYHAISNEPLLKQALRNALNIIKSQAKKNKSKFKSEKRRGKRNFLKNILKSDRSYEEPSGSFKDENSLSVSENFSRKPLTPEEAVFFLKDSNENAYMFLNVETNNMAVVFFNKNNNISLIDADIEK